MSIKLASTQLKQSDNFVYLGGVISVNSSFDKNVARRIGIDSDDIWKSKEITADTKVKLYQSLVQSSLLYNSETWTIKEEHEWKLSLTLQDGCASKNLWHNRHDRIRNMDVKKDLGIENDITYVTVTTVTVS